MFKGYTPCCEHTVDVDPGVVYLSLVESQCYCGQVVHHVFVAKLEIGRVVSSLALHIDRHFVTTLYEIRDLKPDITKQISIYVDNYCTRSILRKLKYLM